MPEIKTTAYGYSVQVLMPFAEALQKVKQVFASQGFEQLTEVNLQGVMQEKLQLAMGEYVVLGMYNPLLDIRAIQAEADIGLLLPCNVVVRKEGEMVVIAAQKPQIFGMLSQNVEVGRVASEADVKIIAALRAV